MKILFLRIADSTFSIPISPLKCYFMVFSPFPVYSFFYLPIRFLYSPIFPAHNFSCFYMTRLFINPILTVSYYRFSIFILFIYLLIFYFTILYWFCHTSTWIRQGCTRVPHPELPSHLPPHTIPLGHPSAPAPSILYPASNLDWQFISYMILYMFQCHSPISSCLHPLPQSPKDCSIHLCLVCCLAYRVISLLSF